MRKTSSAFGMISFNDLDKSDHLYKLSLDKSATVPSEKKEPTQTDKSLILCELFLDSHAKRNTVKLFSGPGA